MREELQTIYNNLCSFFKNTKHDYIDLRTSDPEVVWIEVNDEGVEIYFSWEQKYEYQPFLRVPWEDLDDLPGFLDRKWAEELKKRELEAIEKKKLEEERKKLNSAVLVSRERYNELLSFEEAISRSK